MKGFACSCVPAFPPTQGHVVCVSGGVGWWHSLCPKEALAQAHHQVLSTLGSQANPCPACLPLQGGRRQENTLRPAMHLQGAVERTSTLRELRAPPRWGVEALPCTPRDALLANRLKEQATAGAEAEKVRMMENLAENPQEGRPGFPTGCWGTFR